MEAMATMETTGIMGIMATTEITVKMVKMETTEIMAKMATTTEPMETTEEMEEQTATAVEEEEPIHLPLHPQPQLWNSLAKPSQKLHPRLSQHLVSSSHTSYKQNCNLASNTRGISLTPDFGTIIHGLSNAHRHTFDKMWDHVLFFSILMKKFFLGKAEASRPVEDIFLMF